MLAQYGENCIMQRKVYQWVERFQSGRTSIVQEDHSGHLTTTKTADNVKWANATVQEDRWITVANRADKFDINCGSAYAIIHKEPGYHKICKAGAKAAYRWVQMSTCGNMYAIFAVILWRWGYPAMVCYSWWNMDAPLWTWKQTSKHGVSHIIPQAHEIQKCAFCQRSNVDYVLGL